jgi:glycine/D-amino acid oxidase-like deaminating enzyme
VKVAEHTGGIPVTDPLTLDRTLDEGEERRVADVVRARLPGLGTDLARHAACMYTMTPDSHFLIGHHPESSRVAIAAGFSGHGFKFASLVGLVLAELALDGETAWPIGFLSPRRFPACP